MKKQYAVETFGIYQDPVNKFCKIEFKINTKAEREEGVSLNVVADEAQVCAMLCFISNSRFRNKQYWKFESKIREILNVQDEDFRIRRG